METQLQKISARSRVTAKVLIKFMYLTGFCNQYKWLWNLFSRVMERGKELAVSSGIIILINPFTHLSLGTSEGPKTCQAITQLHRSVHKILCITLAVICACYVGTSSTCVRWRQRKQLFWETKSISTVAKPCPCFWKSDWEQQHLSIWRGKKVSRTCSSKMLRASWWHQCNHPQLLGDLRNNIQS